jgi:hypothetical protein
LLTLDPIVGMAGADPDRLAALTDAADAGTPALEDLFAKLRAEAEDGELADLSSLDVGPGPPEMQLQAFEHYDYIVLLYRNGLDWSRAKELFGIRQEAFTLRDGVSRKVGMGRVVDGRRLFALLGLDKDA